MINLSLVFRIIYFVEDVIVRATDCRSEHGDCIKGILTWAGLIMLISALGLNLTNWLFRIRDLKIVICDAQPPSLCVINMLAIATQVPPLLYFIALCIVN
jgi:hypothetical protein